MGCNCGNKNAQYDFVYTDSKGRQVTYNSEVEAKAAKIRAGGVGEVKPA